MHEYFFDVTSVRLAIIIGVIASMMFYEQVQLTTGGAIVPGYLALFLVAPLLVAPLFVGMTLVTAFLTFFVVNRFLAKRFILYARRKYEVEILTALILVSIWFGLAHFAVRLHPLFTALYGIGFVIPAVIAHDMFRQGPGKTVLAVLVNTVVVGLFIYIFHSLTMISPWAGERQVEHLLRGAVGYPL